MREIVLTMNDKEVAEMETNVGSRPKKAGGPEARKWLMQITQYLIDFEAEKKRKNN